MKREIARNKSQGIKFTISFDEWTSPAATQMINIIVHFPEHDFNLGLINMTKNANAENLADEILSRLSEFGIERSDVKFIIADGARVNSKISRIFEIPIMRCINHGIQLAIVDLFYQKRRCETHLSDIHDEDTQNTESES